MTRPRNASHDYEASMLAWSVRQSINGGTDFYTLAMFETEVYARAFMAQIAAGYSDGSLSVVEVGTAYREPVAS